MKRSTRRDALKLFAATGATATLGAGGGARGARAAAAANTGPSAAASAILDVAPLGFQWPVLDPFIFCAHHDDHYPAGNDRLGPAASLSGRNLGNDFDAKDGWRMYHGEVVPGFPRHPHRGFETVTVVRTGLLDHSDSLGATARYGGGDVQWLTAGKGIQHAEMFPLLDPARPNPLELFQLWLNLPAKDKMVEPHFSMMWNDSIPRRTVRDSAGRAAEVTVIAGRLAGARAPAPPPHSFAARPDSDVAIWTVKLEPGARFRLPPARRGSNRALYFFRGSALHVDGQAVPPRHRIVVRAERPVTLEGGSQLQSDETELLVLQGRPIGEPVAQYGPFVMNTRDEIRQAFSDFEATQFGGWPWKSADPVHARDKGRFALHTDGRLDKPKSA